LSAPSLGEVRLGSTAEKGCYVKRALCRLYSIVPEASSLDERLRSLKDGGAIAGSADDVVHGEDDVRDGLGRHVFVASESARHAVSIR